VQNLLLIIAVLSAVLYGALYIGRAPTLGRTASKTLAIAALALFAAFAEAPMLLVLGLIFSALGDLFLSRDGDKVFLAGMAAFFTAHVAYILQFISLGSAGDILGGRLPAAGVMILFTGLIYRFLWPGLGSFRVPVALYSLAILGMGLSALDLPMSGPTFWILIGAGLFVLSDSVLAIEKFHLTEVSHLNQIAQHIVWITYWLAQASIMFGVIKAV